MALLPKVLPHECLDQPWQNCQCFQVSLAKPWQKQSPAGMKRNCWILIEAASSQYLSRQTARTPVAVGRKEASPHRSVSESHATWTQTRHHWIAKPVSSKLGQNLAIFNHPLHWQHGRNSHSDGPESKPMHLHD